MTTRTAPRTARWRGGSQHAAAVLFLIPTALVFGVFAWWPILRSLLLSFQRTNLVDPAAFVGLDNFRTLLADPLLGTAVQNTLLFTGIALLIGFPLPVLLAVLMSELRKGSGLMRVLVYLPVVVPPVVAVLMWKWFYDPDSGLFNQLLGQIGLGPYPWLQSTSTAMPSLVLEATWAARAARCSSIWPRWPAYPPSCTRLRSWTGRRCGDGCGTSPCRTCAPSC